MVGKEMQLKGINKSMKLVTVSHGQARGLGMTMNSFPEVQ